MTKTNVLAKEELEEKIKYDEEKASKDVDVLKARIYNSIRRNNKLLSEEELGKLLTLAKSNNKRIANRAKDDIIKHNIGLVMKVVSFYKKHNVDYDDLMQEGLMGLMEAIDKYDFEKAQNSKFSSYATWWIRRYISVRALEQSKIIKVPTNLMWSVIRVDNFEKEYSKMYSEKASNEHIAKELGMTAENVAEFKRIKKVIQTISTDQYADYEQTKLVGETIEANYLEQPENVYETTELSQEINVVLQRFLNEREVFIIEHLFGLNGKKIMTMQEISVIFKLTKVRISQLKNKALKALIKNREKLELEQYIC